MTSAIRVDSREAATPAGPARTRDKVIYWVSTSLVSAVMVFSVVNFTFNDHFPAWDQNGPSAFTHLGLPHWFKVELTIAKVLGLLALWVPGVPRTLKEFAYAGFGITLVSATVAHAASEDAPEQRRGDLQGVPVVEAPGQRLHGAMVDSDP